MKVAIDIRKLHSQHLQRGIGIYTRRLCHCLKEFEDENFSVKLIEKGELPGDIDLVHYPWFDLFWPTLSLPKNLPAVITIHDLIPLRFPKHFPAGIKGSISFLRQKRSLKKIDRIITDSIVSKKDITKFLKIPENKIDVVYLAAAEEFKQLTTCPPTGRINNQQLAILQKKYSLPKRFLLYVGDVNYNKNVEGLIKAFWKLKTQSASWRTKRKTTTKNLKLALIGKAFFDKNLEEAQNINRLIKGLNLETDIIKLGFVPKEDLVALYNLAAVYCQPSFYEGFGLPVLEAMACGTPVVVSQTSSLPEVVGEAGVFVNPKKVESITQGLKQVLQSSKDNYLSWAKKGLERAKKFSWPKTAQETIKVYHEVLAEK